MSVSEEEVEEESGCGGDMAVSSDHAIYAPKPTYDQLDQYSSLSKRGEEKQRRSGLVTIKPQVGSGSGGGSVSSESEEESTTLCPSPRRNRPVLNRHPRCLSDPEVAPLSPPPSLDKEEEDEEELVEKEEEEPELPSTPESDPSNASAPELYTTTARVMISNIKEDEEDAPVSRLHVPLVTVITTTTITTSTTTTVPSTNVVFNPISPTATSIPEVNEEVNEESSSGGTGVFPSLQDIHLRAAGISIHDPPPNENLSSQEIENKFKQISLAFKTDRLTLRQRLDVQQRQRDIAESNFERELDHLRSSILALHEDCIDMELVDAVMQVRKHLDVLTTSSSSLLSASEVWGAVQQEWRVSRALEVLLLHVENVKRLYEHDHQELEEMRRILTEHQIELPVSPGAAGSSQSSTSDSALASRRIRALSLAGVGKQSQEGGNRRISLGPGASKTVLKDFLGGRPSRRRASLMPDLRPFHQELAAVAAAAAANAASGSYLSKEKMEEKRHSTNGMLGSSITEEGSESGDEVTTNTGPGGTSDNSPTTTPITKLNHFPLDLYGPCLQDSDQRSNEDDDTSPVHTPTTESCVSNQAVTSLVSRSQHWLMLGVEDVLGWVRGGRWPYSPQQTYRGARYAFTSLLLLLAAFFLLLTISSGNDGVQQICPPGWTTMHHRLHPFVTIHCMGTQPT